MTETSTKTTPSRRSVVRAGATAAWAVPAISLASAAPSFAGTTTSYTATVTAVAVTPGAGAANMNVGATVTNTGDITLTSVDFRIDVSEPMNGWINPANLGFPQFTRIDPPASEGGAGAAQYRTYAVYRWTGTAAPGSVTSTPNAGIPLTAQDGDATGAWGSVTVVATEPPTPVGSTLTDYR